MGILNVQVHPDCHCSSSEQDIKHCAPNVPGHMIQLDTEEIRDSCETQPEPRIESFLAMSCRRATDQWEQEEGTQASALDGRAESDFESYRHRVELHGSPYKRTDTHLSDISEESVSVDLETMSLHQLAGNDLQHGRGCGVNPFPDERYAQNKEFNGAEMETTHISRNGGLRNYFGGILRWFSKEG